MLSAGPIWVEPTVDPDDQQHPEHDEAEHRDQSRAGRGSGRPG